MYNPPTFLTVELLAEVLGEFDWPAGYTLDEDEDGIAVRFPDATFYVGEGFESQMEAWLHHPASGLGLGVNLLRVLAALRLDGPLPPVRLIDDPEPYATEAKVRNGIRDLCTLVLAYLPLALIGDLGWVDAVRRYEASHGRG